jgi:hypothetical protein
MQKAPIFLHDIPPHNDLRNMQDTSYVNKNYKKNSFRISFKER